MLRWVIGMLLLMGWTVGLTQVRLVAAYDMDGCSLFDPVGGLDGIILFNPDPCACGVLSNGLQFPGGLTSASFDDDLNEVFRGDWSMTFYVRFENTGEETVDLFFLGENCGRDSIFSVRYFPTAERFRVRQSDSPNNEVQLDAQSDPNTCWQYVAIVNQGPVMRLYINGELISQEAAVSPLSLNVNGSLEIAGSPCLDIAANADQKFVGRLDELMIYEGAITETTIRANYAEPDQIITTDTTVFVGSPVRIQTGGTCSNTFSWSPSTFLSDASELNPMATPTTTTTYQLLIEDVDCTVTDEVRINVVDAEDLSCDDLMLPNAFTPNNDNVNDRYGISNQFLIEDLTSFEIFNRWGGRVFFTNEIDGAWDGFQNGQQAPSASYVYLVNYTCEGQQLSSTGTLHLIR